jgi:hypothetical protein
VLLPIFPLSPKIDYENNKKLEDAFKSQPKSLLNKIFLDELKNRNLWWSDYIILDKIALEMIMDFVGNPNHVERANTIKSILSVRPRAMQEKEPTYQKQIVIMSYLCRSVNKTDPSRELTPILALMPDHIRTNITPPDLIDWWKNMKSYQGGISCVFPTLNP